MQPVGAVSSKWAKGTGGPAGDECQNLVSAYGETGQGYWQPGVQCLRAEGENRPSRPSNVIAFNGSQDPDVSGGVTHPVGRNQGQEACVAFIQNQCGDVLTGGVTPALGTNQNATGRNTAKVLATGVRRLTSR